MNAAAVRSWWSGLAARERLGVVLAALALAGALLWWLALAPALRTLAMAAAHKADLQAQWQLMQSQASQAQALQRQPRLSRDDTVRALEESVRQRLAATAQLSVQEERVVLTLKGASAQALAQWLATVRVQARLVPGEAHLTRSAAAASKATDLWDGTVVLTLPKRATP